MFAEAHKHGGVLGPVHTVVMVVSVPTEQEQLAMDMIDLCYQFHTLDMYKIKLYRVILLSQVSYWYRIDALMLYWSLLNQPVGSNINTWWYLQLGWKADTSAFLFIKAIPKGITLSSSIKWSLMISDMLAGTRIAWRVNDKVKLNSWVPLGGL